MDKIGDILGQSTHLRGIMTVGLSTITSMEDDLLAEADLISLKLALLSLIKSESVNVARSVVKLYLEKVEWEMENESQVFEKETKTQT